MTEAAPGSGLAGRRVLITGGSSGIGAAVAIACAAGGASVGIIGRDAKRLEDMAAATGGVARCCDLADPAACEAAVAAIAFRLGGLDALVNSAGLMLHSRLDQGLSDEWRAMFEVNVLGVLNATHAALVHLRAAAHADIVNLSSVSADGASRSEFSIYAATKAALAQITKAVRGEAAEHRDIRVCEVKPGIVDTPGFGPGIHDEEIRTALEAAKRERGMKPARVAEVIVHVLTVPREISIETITVVGN